MEIEVNETQPVFQDKVECDVREIRDGDNVVGYIHTPKDIKTDYKYYYSVEFPSGNTDVVGFMRKSAFEFNAGYFINDMISELDGNTIYNTIIMGVKDA